MGGCMERPLDIPWLQGKVRQFKADGYPVAAEVVLGLIRKRSQSAPQS